MPASLVRTEEGDALSACWLLNICPAWIIDELGQGPVRCCLEYRHDGDHDSFGARAARRHRR